MLGELFERVANVDVELRCLGTKAFVAKEQFVNDVLYSRPKKSSKSEEEKKEETKAEVSDLMDKIQKDKAEGKDTTKLEEELKEKMNEFLASEKEEEKPVTKEDINDLMSKIENGKANGEDTTKLEEELKEKMDKFLTTPAATKVCGGKRLAESTSTGTGAKRRAEPTSTGTGAKRRADAPTVPDVTVGEGVEMDFSGQVQPGVTYAPPTVNPYIDAQASVEPVQEEAKPADKAKK